MDYALLPKIDKILLIMARESKPCSRPLLLRAARQAVEQLRAELPERPEADRKALLARALELTRDNARRLCEPSLVRVINATGVVLHTNLGRAPLADNAVRAVEGAARHYCNLELDLSSGQRGDRHEHVRGLLQELTGAGDALVVNNNAAAIFLVLNTLAAGGEAIISRGQLVEIGGSLRVSDIIEKSGARMVEVGSTNKTYLRDYRAAINGQTRLLLNVHPGNFRMGGFTGSVSHRDLAELAHSQGLPLYNDLGSGCVFPLAERGLSGEPLVSQVVADQVDLISFSGDKLLGGPQAGIVVGNCGYIEALRANPLHRALRVDKFTLAALEATLLLYRAGRAETELPALQMILAKPEQLRAKALRLAELLAGCPAAVRLADGVSEVGGGSLPLVELPTTLVTIKPRQNGSAALVERLRLGNPALVAYIREDKIILDPRTIEEEEIPLAAELIRQALNGTAT